MQQIFLSWCHWVGDLKNHDYRDIYRNNVQISKLGKKLITSDN